MSYREHRSTQHTLDSAIPGLVHTSSWFSAAWGVAVFLAVVLAQTWNESQSATRTACIASAWLLGSLLGLHLSHSLRRPTFVAPLWGSAYLGCALAWWFGVGPWLSLPHQSHPATLLGDAPFIGTVAFLMGVTSSCWLVPRRPWFAAGEQVSLAREMVCLPLGLFVTWALPQWTGLLGFLFLVPLFVLDLALPAPLAFLVHPAIAPGRSRPGAEDPATWPPLQLDRRGSSRWWRVGQYGAADGAQPLESWL